MELIDGGDVRLTPSYLTYGNNGAVDLCFNCVLILTCLVRMSTASSASIFLLKFNKVEC